MGKPPAARIHHETVCAAHRRGRLKGTLQRFVGAVPTPTPAPLASWLLRIHPRTPHMREHQSRQFSAFARLDETQDFFVLPQRSCPGFVGEFQEVAHAQDAELERSIELGHELVAGTGGDGLVDGDGPFRRIHRLP